jgi:hypothetical protein
MTILLPFARRASLSSLTICCTTESKSEILYDWRFTANQFVLETSLSDTRPVFFQLNTCGHRRYVTSSLTRGWVCRLQLLLALASGVILSSESRGTHDHILLSQIRGSPPNWRPRSPYSRISPRNRVAQLYPHALCSLFVASYDS